MPNLRLGTPAAKLNLIADPFETNQEAKFWWIVSPDGKHYHIRNLLKFCRDHPDLFAPDPGQNAYAGLLQVQAWLMIPFPKQSAATPAQRRRRSRWAGVTIACVLTLDGQRHRRRATDSDAQPLPSDAAR